MESIFRVLVVGAAVLSIVFWCIPVFDYMWLTNEQLQILDLGGFGSYISDSRIFYWGTLTIWLLLSIGLLFYVNIARFAFVICMVIVHVLSFFYGISILSPLEAFIGSLITMADGAIITMMYLTSISGKFNENT